MFDAGKHHRQSVRLAGYDYRHAGAYFVTVCAAQRRAVFGRIENEAMRLHPYGRIVAACWQEIGAHFPHVALDEWVVMPNHFHGILLFKENATDSNRRGTIYRAQTSGVTDEGMIYHAPTGDVARFAKPVAGSVATIIGTFKAGATRNINRHRKERGLAPVVLWQRNYFERIIRDENELMETRRYIIENPQNWPHDSEFVAPEVGA